MNTRLLAYLRSLGLAQNSDDAASWEFYSGLRGLQRSIANCLNYVEEDSQARTNCDLQIRSLGYDPQNPSEQMADGGDGGTTTATRSAAIGSDGASEDGTLERHLEESRVQGAETERARVNAIYEYGELAGASDEVIRGLVADPTVTEEIARSRFLEDHRSRTRSNLPQDTPNAGPAIHGRNSQTGHDAQALSAALMLRSGVNDPTQRWFEHNPMSGMMRFRDASSDSEVGRSVDRGHELSGLSMVEISRRALAIDGINVEPTARAIVNAFQQRAAMSAATLNGVFLQTFGAQLLAGFDATEDSTQSWTRDNDNPNFFSIPRARMGKASALTKHGKGATAEDLTISDSVENTKINRYSGKFVIDEQDLINDTFGALNSVMPDQMGESARQLRPDLVYGALMANGNMRDGNALFSAPHANLLPTNAFSITALKAALTALKIQKDGDRNLNLRGKYLIVPETLAFEVAETIKSAGVVIAGDTDRTRGVMNVLSTLGLVVVSDARLDNGVIDPDSGNAISGSTSTWYLASESRNHTMEVTYLRGASRSPELRTVPLGLGQFGVGFDVHMDIGVKPLSWEGWNKSTA